jgi:hypothetical protein
MLRNETATATSITTNVANGIVAMSIIFVSPCTAYFVFSLITIFALVCDSVKVREGFPKIA